MGISAADWAAISAEIVRLARLARGLSSEQWAALPPAAQAGYVQRWRLENLYWIEDEHGHKVKFRPTPIQRRFFDSLWWRSVVLKARQVRLSTAALLLELDRVLFSENHTAGVVDKTDEDAKRKLARIKFAYDHLDDPDDPRTAPLGALLKKLIRIRFSNAHEFQLSNESKIWASTSMRGGTLNTLWVSELGVTAVEFPEKAKEIRKGALNAIHEGALAIIEATFEGGRFGVFYEMIRLAQRTPEDPRLRNPVQWAFCFFGWADEPSYTTELPTPLLPSPKHVAYFANLERVRGAALTQGQKNWYILKSQEQGADMVTEFPGTAEEAMQAIPEGAIYGEQMILLRATGRICPLVKDGYAPLLTAWDLGESDATGVWLLQVVGPDIHALDYHCANGATPAEHARAVLVWEAKWGPIAAHYLPHDGTQRKAGTTWAAELKKAGLNFIKIVERVANVWIGINQTRGLLPRFRFNSDTCEKEFPMAGGTIWPSGVAGLEAYRKRATVNASGNVSWNPIHDETESAASSLRTFAEAHARGMLVGPTDLEHASRRAAVGPQRAVTGLRGRDLHQPAKAITGLRLRG